MGHRKEKISGTAPKGFIYTLEVLIAITLILISVTVILRNPPVKPEFDSSRMKIQGFNVLEYMDNKNDLRNLVSQNNETEIESRIANLLPKEMQFETEICGLSCSETNVPVNETVIAINYYVSGFKDSYLGKKLKMWIWRKS